MQITIKVGNVLTEAADVLISTANPWLNLSGGVNGAIRKINQRFRHDAYQSGPVVDSPF